MANPRVAIVVPCYNEAKRLPVRRFEEFFQKSDIDFLFVDDGSRDKTKEVLHALRDQFPGKVAVIVQERNCGKAEAVRRGMSIAIERGYEFAGFWDADLATPLGEIREFLQLFAEQPELDMVFGSRVKLLGRQIERKTMRHYLGRVFATFVSTMLGLPIYDSQCGAKIFRIRSTTHTLFDRPFLSRWIFDVEILARYLSVVGSHAALSSIYEFPLHSWIDVDGSKVKPTDFFVAFRDVLRIRGAYQRKK